MVAMVRDDSRRWWWLWSKMFVLGCLRRCERGSKGVRNARDGGGSQGECPKYMMKVERQKRSLYNTLETGSPTADAEGDLVATPSSMNEGQVRMPEESICDFTDKAS